MCQTTLSTTPSAYKLYLDLKEDDQDQYVLYLWYKEWSDDFDPNNTKASQNQVWSNTFTICPPEGESQGRNSSFMSLSCKGEDHSEIEIEFQKELDALSNEGKMFYHGGLKRIIKVKMGKLLYCVDRPERTSILLPVGDGANNIHVECNTRNNTIQACNGRKYASWDVLHPSFKLCVPANYPTNYDQRPGASLPPNGRELNLPI